MGKESSITSFVAALSFAAGMAMGALTVGPWTALVIIEAFADRPANRLSPDEPRCEDWPLIRRSVAGCPL